MKRLFYPQNKDGFGCIYRIINLINGKQYIGQTANKYSSKRWDAHKFDARKGCERPLYRAMRKYGIDNFEFKVMLINIPKEKLDFYEILWIKKLNTSIPNGYNLSKGGQVFDYKGEDHPASKRIPWNKRIPRSEECKNKIKASWTESRKQLYSKKFSGKNNPQYRKHPKGISRYGEENPFFRKHHSNITKEKLRETSGRYRKEIIRCDLNTDEELQIYPSTHEAARWIKENTSFSNPDHSCLSKCAKGKQKYAYGYKWKFKE